MHVKEFYGSESLSQRYFFIAELKQKFPGLNVIVHDDACHLRKFATARSGDSELAFNLAFPQVAYVTDGFHSTGHIDEWCKANCDPKLPHNAELVKDVNTSICEQTFRETNRFKYMVQHMHRFTATVFVNEIMDLRNASKGI